MSNKWRVYIKPFDDSGTYTSYSDVTSDIVFNSLGNINSDLDNTEYNIGVYRLSNVKITLRNEHGYYSDVGQEESIFKYKRTDSLVKITWEIEEDGPYAGVALTDGCFLSEETTMFEGLLNDESLSMDLESQQVSFNCLGRESMFLRTIVPFGSISNGNLYSAVIYALLNQTAITNLLTVSNGNITCGSDQTIDSITGLQNKTVQDGLNDLLLASNSVLYVSNSTIYVSPRTAGSTVVFTFYGQGSNNGVENIQAIKNIKNGLAKTFNFFSWTDTTLYSTDATSTAKYGSITKEISFDFCTDNTKRQAILDALKNEFKNPKQEFDIYTPLTYTSLVVGLLDKISIDYPRVYVADQGVSLPICGVAVCGTGILPKAQWSFLVSSTDYYKVIGKSIDVQNSTLKFKVRLI